MLGPTHTIYRKRALQIIGGIWILSAVVATPTFVDYSVHLEPMTSQYVGNTTAVTSQMVCRPKSNVFDKVNGVFILFASYMIPQVFIFSRYYRLVTFIKRQARQTTGGMTSSFVSEEDYKDVGHHRSSLLLRLAALLRSPCRCCKFLFVCYCFLLDVL